MKIIIFLFILIFNTNEIVAYIVFPIKTLPKDFYVFSKDNSEKSTIKKYFHSDVYINFQIGNSPQKVPIFLSLTKSIFQMTSSLSAKSSSLEEPEIYKLPKNNFFNEENSYSFKYNNEINIENKKYFLANDTIIFSNNLDLKNNLEKTINFQLLLQFQKENIPGEIGFAFPNKNEDQYYLLNKTNILNQLKENNLIKNYNYFLLYDKWNNNDGKLVIGSAPHDLFPKKYSKKDLIWANSLIDSSIGHNWKIKFREISLGSFHMKNLTSEIIFDSEVICAPKELDFLLLKLFLQEEIDNKRCFYGSYYLKTHYITTVKYYYCDINIQKEINEVFPNIKLNSKEFNYTFEINKNDLLQVEGNYIFFKILFFIESYDIWLLGKPFSLKYQFIFNPDTKQIGIYNPDFVYEKTRILSSKKFWLVFLIIILCIIFTILGIIIGKKLYGLKRKQKANELIDDFDYISSAERNNSSNNDINKNNNYSIKNSVSSYKTIEMNTKLY